MLAFDMHKINQLFKIMTNILRSMEKMCIANELKNTDIY